MAAIKLIAAVGPDSTFSSITIGPYCYCNIQPGKRNIREGRQRSLREFQLFLPEKQLATGELFA